MGIPDVRLDVEAVGPILMMDRLMTAMSFTGLSVFLSGAPVEYLQRRAERRFAAEGDDVTGKWAPLKPATILMRQAQGFGPGPINHRTGELENWVTGGSFDVTPFSEGGAALEYPRKPGGGELLKKVRTAQSGDPKTNTVARPVLGVNEADAVFITAELMFFLDKAVRV